jgi:hypothetical protein
VVSPKFITQLRSYSWRAGTAKRRSFDSLRCATVAQDDRFLFSELQTQETSTTDPPRHRPCDGPRRSIVRTEKALSRQRGPFCVRGCRRVVVDELEAPYLVGAGVKPSRLCPGSGFGFGLGAFLTSFLPLSLLPMGSSVTQNGAPGEDRKDGY